MGSSTIAKRISHRSAIVLATLIALSGPAPAQTQGTPEGRRACTPDVYRLCAGEIPNVRAIITCLQRQKGNLSPACRTAMAQGGY